MQPSRRHPIAGTLAAAPPRRRTGRTEQWHRPTGRATGWSLQGSNNQSGYKNKLHSGHERQGRDCRKGCGAWLPRRASRRHGRPRPQRAGPLAAIKSQLAHEVDARLERLAAGLPLGWANLAAVGGHKLGGLNLAQQLVGVAADAVVLHLGHLYQAIGVN